MPVPPSTELLVRERLHQAGRLTTAHEILTFRSVTQNPERRDSATVQRHIVVSGTTPVAFLITGPDLSDLRQRTELFSITYPALACPVFAHGKAQDQEFLLTEYFDGINAGDALTESQIGLDRVLVATRERVVDEFFR